MSFYMRFPSEKTKALTLSYDDGVEQDIYLAKIFAEANVEREPLLYYV